LLLPLTLINAQDSTPVPDAQVVADDILRLRAAPSTDSDILTLLDSATPLTILGVSEDRIWLHVQTRDDLIGWVAIKYVDLHIDLDTLFPPGGTTTRLLPAVVDHIRTVYADGQRLGNYANVFAKIGDSITESILTLNPIGDGLYDLGDYGYLQGVIDFYSQGATRDDHNSFNDLSLAAKVGWTTYRVLNPIESDPEICEDGESPLLCEYRILQPSVALIMFGTNDVSVLDPGNFRANLNAIVDLTEARGIIPILSTIPVRIRYEAQVVQFNRIIVDVAAQHSIPLLDYGGAMLPLGSDGFDLDKVHPSVPPKGYAGAADFRADNLHYGYVIRNLTALQMLDLVWHATAASN
jgi:hypothetical protein